MSSSSDKDKVSSTSKSSKRSSRKGGKKQSATENHSDDVQNDVSDVEYRYPCMECSYVGPSPASLRMHSLRKHTQKTSGSASASEPSDFEVDELAELRREKQRLTVQSEINKLRKEVDQTDGGSPDHHLQQKVFELQQQLDKRDMQDLISNFDRKFEILQRQIEHVRHDGNRQPVHHPDERLLQDLRQSIFKLEREVQRKDETLMMSEIEHLKSRLDATQNRSPQPFEIEGDMNKKFLDVSTDVFKEGIREIGMLRKDMRNTRDQISREFLPLLKTLSEKVLRVKLEEEAAKEEFQPEERELTPEQLARVDEVLDELDEKDTDVSVVEETETEDYDVGEEEDLG